MLPLLTAAISLLGQKQQAEQQKQAQKVAALRGEPVQQQGGQQGNGLQNALNLLGQFKGGGQQDQQPSGKYWKQTPDGGGGNYGNAPIPPPPAPNGNLGNLAPILDGHFNTEGKISDQDLLNDY